MTTKVMIFAEHRWPVDAVLVDSKKRTILSTQRIAIDTVGTLYLHAGADLYIHEVQPDELGADNYDDEASAAADLADAKARSEATGQPIPDPLIDPVVTIAPSTNQIVEPDPATEPAATDQGATDAETAAAAQAAQEAADAQAAAEKQATDDAAAAAAAEQEAAAQQAQQQADAAAAQAKIDADAAQKEIDDQAAADAAAQQEADADAAQKLIDDQAAAASASGATSVDTSGSNSDLVAATDQTLGTDPVDEEDPAKVTSE